MGAVYKLTDKTIVSSGYGRVLDRDGGDHHAVHDADVSVSARTSRSERSTTSRQRSC
jgi:hypothetical protein